MLSKIVEFVLARRGMVLGVLILFMIAGAYAFSKLNIEAYPDPSPPMMEIITQSAGQSAEEMERYITIPIEIAMAGLPGLQHIRSSSLYGLSDIKVQFSYDTDYNYALQQVLNRLTSLPPLPNGAQPSISPESAVGEIYRYQLVAPPNYSLRELKTLQDWVLEKRFRTIPGVIDVVGWGGLTKEFHVDVDLEKLAAYHVTLPQVVAAISNSNLNVGARTLDIGEQAANVRGIGLIHSLADIDSIVLSQQNGVPVQISDVAKTELGHTQRLGIAGRDKDNDVVEGIVLMRRGDKTLEVLKSIEAEVQKMNTTNVLPKGVQIVSYYNRRELIGVTTHTVLHNLVFGVALLFLIQLVFLGDLRSAIVVSASIPVALFFSILIMYLRGDSANLLSVGAIDFGIIVDATVIMVENIFRHLSEHSPNTIGQSGLSKRKKILAAATEVGSSVFFSTAIIIAAFLPLFTMQGVEGQIFGPMAKTYGYAMIGALLATFAVAPVLSSYLLPDHVSEKEPFIMRLLRPIYLRILTLALKFRTVTLALGVALLVLMAVILPQLGTEFLPKLDEGNLWIRATMPATISIEAGAPKVSRIREILSEFPEVTTVVSQHGRPDDGTDPTGFFNAEFFVPLKPSEEWPKGILKKDLIDEMKKKLESELVGIDFNFSQTIEDNVEEAVSGVKGENSVKLFGSDLKTLEKTAGDIKAQLDSVHGIEDAGVSTVLGQPNLLIEVDRQRCARYGLATGDVNAMIQAAVGGQSVTDLYENERHFPVVVRLMPRFRQSIDSIKAIQVATPGGALVSLADVCNIAIKSGASYIYRENNERYIPIKFSVRGRDLGSAVAEAQSNILREIHLPAEYHIDWSGEFGELNEAVTRLALIVPIGILLIIILLHSTFDSMMDSMLVMASIPLTFVGGVLALYFTNTTFSVAAAVGFISLLGVAVMAGIILISYYNQLRGEGLRRETALIRACDVRLRPVLMMCMSACIGLLPAAISHGIGSETQRPLAMVIVGGMMLAPILILLILPVLVSFRPIRSPASIENMEPGRRAHDRLVEADHVQ